MTLVTVAEARENLIDLLRRAATGEQIVITEDGQYLAALGKPPVLPTPEEEAARQARAEAFVREWLERAATERILTGDAPATKAG